ncbi:MAG TPA: biotin-dependent carboxyltransferase family protein [Opitutaceae bacterium]|nr:biotin-dependent carboxyltransferase family protein [Opitutaceae bacterium]
MIEILKAPPFATVQDAGRLGWRTDGLPPSGAIDLWSLRLANVIVGNNADAPALEWLLGGGSLRFDRASAFCLAGARVEAWLDGMPVEDRQVCFAPQGSVLNVGGFISGRTLYIAIEGGIAVPRVLGSASTYLPGHFGGHLGRKLLAHDRVPLGPRRWPPPCFNPTWVERLPQPRDAATARFIFGPNWEDLSAIARTRLVGHAFRISPDSDRAGVRLGGKIPCEGLNFAAPSEPVIPGTIELTSDGSLIVLLADGPTSGGYPKPGVVIQADVPVIAQRRPGANLRFVEVTPSEALIAAHQARSQLADLANQVRPKRSRLPDTVSF